MRDARARASWHVTILLTLWVTLLERCSPLQLPLPIRVRILLAWLLCWANLRPHLTISHIFLVLHFHTQSTKFPHFSVGKTQRGISSPLSATIFLCIPAGVSGAFAWRMLIPYLHPNLHPNPHRRRNPLGPAISHVASAFVGRT